VNDSKSVASQKMLAKSVFSVCTSKITSDGLDEEETDEDEGSDYKGSATKTSAVEIEGMQMLTREQSKNKSSVTGQKEKLGENQRVHALEDKAQLTKNMNKATAKLNLSSVDRDPNMEEDVEEDKDEFDDAMDREEESELDTSYVVQSSDLPNLFFEVDPDSNDKENKDFSEDDLSIHLEDHSLGQDYDSSSEVASGVFKASYTNTFEEPNSFKELLWNISGSSVGSMIIFLDLLKDNLEAEEAGLSAEFNKIPANLLDLLVEEAGKKNGEQIEYIEVILKALDKISQTNSHDEAPSPDKGTNEEASKTQGTLPGAHKASPAEEATNEPATPAGRDKEGAQSLSMASTG